MTTLYKLTTQDHKTRKGHDNECLWGTGVTHSGTGEGDLCGPGYIHAYTDPLIAVLLNPVHADITDPVMWECEGDIAKTGYDLKVGCVTLTTIRIIPLPEVTPEQRVRIAILAALQVFDDPDFASWARGWLDGTDRSEWYMSAQLIERMRTIAKADVRGPSARAWWLSASAAVLAANALAMGLETDIAIMPSVASKTASSLRVTAECINMSATGKHLDIIALVHEVCEKDN